MTTRKSNLHQATQRALRTWGAQKLLMFTGSGGYAPRSIIAKIREEREGAGEGRRVAQRWEEVYTGDGAVVHRIELSMPELPRITMTAYYVLQGPFFSPASEQAEHLGIAVRSYWTYLEIAEYIVDSGLQLLEKSDLSAA
ncbi:MAG: hypothetical protein ACREUT_15560 [Steroidobacteraceae bacterium]